VGILNEVFRYLRNIGGNSVLATSLHQKEAKSLASSEQRKEIQTITVSKSDHLTGSGDNQKPSALFLKRKSIEVLIRLFSF
jgi:hypothetical protein